MCNGCATASWRPEVMPDARDEILRYLDSHGVVDKDRHVKRVVASAPAKQSRISRYTLDLHGKTVVQATSILQNALVRCRQKGVRELLVIHGHGRHSNPDEGPVLKEAVRQILGAQLGRTVRDFDQAMQRDGGEGATLVRLQKIDGVRQ
jgi:DNA-nicking Smr family endonuclease